LPFVKKLAILPTLLTLGNAVCGFAAIAFASKVDAADPKSAVYFVTSAWLIFGAMVFDALDGYVARLSKTASDFGGQLDSLCDAISFGVAPAFLLLRLGREYDIGIFRQAIAVIAAIYMACAILRLARFNVENSPDASSHKRFKGLPSPAAAGCVASLCILRGCEYSQTYFDPAGIDTLVKTWAPVGGLLAALLMVSQVPYPHLTKQLLRPRRQLGHIARVLLLVGLLVLTHELSLFLLFWGYTLSMPLRYLTLRALRQPKSPLDEAVPSPRIR
jgi:CDP-diacylglycerol--serine O-phosphatidyltransferase